MYAQFESTRSPKSSGQQTTVRCSKGRLSLINKAAVAAFALLLAGSAAHAADPNAPPEKLCPGMIYVKFANPPCWPIGTYWPWEYANQVLAVSGSGSPIGVHRIATQFTVAKSAPVAKVLVALSYVSGTDNAANISVYDDAGGVPGKPIQTQRVTSLPAAGACCSYETVALQPEVKLLAGTPYWIVATADDNSDTVATWNLDTGDQVDQVTAAFDSGSGWVAQSILPSVAVGVER